jgi:regulatory protein
MRSRRFNEVRSQTPAAGLDPAKARARVFQRAAKLLAAKPRSVEELRARLLQGRGATKEVVEIVIQRLREYGYLNDARFAQSYASLRVQQRPIGRQRLERDLRLKKIDQETANEALDVVFAATPEEELIARAIEKRIRLRGRPKSRPEIKKFFDHLLRQGFAFELIGEKLRAISKVEVDEDL